MDLRIWGGGRVRCNPVVFSVDLSVIFITSNNVTVGESTNLKVDLSNSSEVSFKILGQLFILSFRFLICKI